jgi:hypothetical protein
VLLSFSFSSSWSSCFVLLILWLCVGIVQYLRRELNSASRNSTLERKASVASGLSSLHSGAGAASGSGSGSGSNSASTGAGSDPGRVAALTASSAALADSQSFGFSPMTRSAAGKGTKRPAGHLPSDAVESNAKKPRIDETPASASASASASAAAAAAAAAASAARGAPAS